MPAHRSETFRAPRSWPRKVPWGQTKSDPLVEVHDEHFVLRVAGPHKRQGRGSHITTLSAHTCAVVHSQSDADRTVLVPEQADVLALPVLEHAKIPHRQPRDKSASPVADGHGKNDPVHVDGNRGACALRRGLSRHREWHDDRTKHGYLPQQISARPTSAADASRPRVP